MVEVFSHFVEYQDGAKTQKLNCWLLLYEMCGTTDTVLTVVLTHAKYGRWFEEYKQKYKHNPYTYPYVCNLTPKPNAHLTWCCESIEDNAKYRALSAQSV